MITMRVLYDLPQAHQQKLDQLTHAVYLSPSPNKGAAMLEVQLGMVVRDQLTQSFHTLLVAQVDLLNYYQSCESQSVVDIILKKGLLEALMIAPFTVLPLKHRANPLVLSTREELSRIKVEHHCTANAPPGETLSFLVVNTTCRLIFDVCQLTQSQTT
jgi:hypothetical protein